MKIKKIIMTLCIVMVFAIFATGCRPIERPVPQEQQVPQQRIQEPQQQAPQQQVPQQRIQDQRIRPEEPIVPQQEEQPVPGGGG